MVTRPGAPSGLPFGYEWARGSRPAAGASRRSVGRRDQLDPAGTRGAVRRLRTDADRRRLLGHFGAVRNGTLTGAESLENPSASSSSGDEDSSFGFDDIASYDDGVEVEIVGTVAQQATTGMTGAETTHGQMVVASVLIRNGSVTAVDAASVLVTAAYGADDTDAPLVVDPTGELANAFLGHVTAGEEATAGYGFAIPFSALGRVIVTVDLGDGEHEPVSFTGAVERDG